ncbi:MAG: ferrous iron transport protein B [Myxococcales bacterium]|nr:ferrous iron transport protein B [Myxococcales bacterium]
MAEKPNLRIALAGNPNAGKTSLFNVLTGSRQHVGNYPGVTVEKRWGHYKAKNQRIDVVDLPGTYSLTSFSPEERVARDELLHTQHDVVVVVADSTALKRSLMLLVQIMQLGATPVLCLNMSDEAMASGQRIDRKRLELELGFPVIETVGHKGKGREDLIEAIFRATELETSLATPSLGVDLDKAIETLSANIGLSGILAQTKAWVATRLLVGDESIADELGAGIRQESIEEAKAAAELLAKTNDQDISLLVTERYFTFIDRLLEKVVKSPRRSDARARSEAIDRVLANPDLGLPVFGVIMFSIFWITFNLGETPMGWIEDGQGLLSDWVTSLWPEGSDSALRSLLVDGVIAGVGGVVVFLPNIVLLFLGLALLEDSGYMARAAYLMDRVMHRFGLHGKSFVPMMTGFGCSIPGIMATRTLENERDRLTTMLVLPLMSCGARLPIWMLLIPAFFAPPWRAPALWGIYCIGILLAFVLALALRKTVLAGEAAPFVMELPPYRIPTVRALVKKMTERAWIYLRKAGTIILAVSIVLWVMSTYPKKDSYEVDAQIAQGVEFTAKEIEQARGGEDLRYSVAGRLGKAVEPLVEPMGFDWKLGTSMIGAFAAKEVFVANLGIVYSMGETTKDSDDLRNKLSRDYSPLVGFSLMLFLLISAPCMATFAITRRESGSWRWAFLQLGGLTLVAFLISTAVYQIGRLLGAG